MTEGDLDAYLVSLEQILLSKRNASHGAFFRTYFHQNPNPWMPSITFVKANLGS